MDDMITYGPVFVANINEDFDLVQKIVERDYTSILKDPNDETYGDHPIKKPGVLWSAPSPRTFPPRHHCPPPRAIPLPSSLLLLSSLPRTMPPPSSPTASLQRASAPDRMARAGGTTRRRPPPPPPPGAT